MKYHAERAARTAADFRDAMPHDGLGPAAGTSDRPFPAREVIAACLRSHRLE